MSADTRTERTPKPPPRPHARLAGLVGFIVLLSGSYSNFVGSSMIVPEDAATTVNNIVASESLFRLGFVSGLVMIVGWLFYALALFRLLRPAGKFPAVMMISLVLAGTPLFMLNQLNQFAAMLVAADEMPAQTMLFLDLHKYGNVISGIFFGLWLFPLGLLVFKSGFLPRILGILLMIGCFGYLILFVQTFLFPGSEATLWANPALLVTHFSELSLLLWLLIMGVNAERWRARTLAAC